MPHPPGWRPCQRAAGPVSIYRGVWLPCARWELPSAHNGEVWLSPCRESARTAAPDGRAAARQPLKLKRYKSDVGGLRPLRAVFYSVARPWA